MAVVVNIGIWMVVSPILAKLNITVIDVRDQSSFMTYVMTRLDRFLVNIHIQHTFDSKVQYAVRVMSNRKSSHIYYQKSFAWITLPIYVPAGACVEQPAYLNAYCPHDNSPDASRACVYCCWKTLQSPALKFICSPPMCWYLCFWLQATTRAAVTRRSWRYHILYNK